MIKTYAFDSLVYIAFITIFGEKVNEKGEIHETNI